MKPVETDATEPWQPLTPRGVARFAAATWRRTAAVLLIFATLAGISIAVFFSLAWFPAIREATASLPNEGYIRGGQLAWTGEPATVLAENGWLAVTVDLHRQQVHRLLSENDLQVEFSTDSIRFLALLGYVDVPYPDGWIIVFNEPELSAWWKAWEPFIAIGIGLVTFCGLLAAWTVLAAAYAIPTLGICRFVNHSLPWSGAMKLCLAAQMPGCLALSFTLLLYSVRAVDLVQLLFVMAAHLAAAWIYIGLAVFFIPAATAKSQKRSNPFQAADAG